MFSVHFNTKHSALTQLICQSIKINEQLNHITGQPKRENFMCNYNDTNRTYDKKYFDVVRKQRKKGIKLNKITAFLTTQVGGLSNTNLSTNQSLTPLRDCSILCPGESKSSYQNICKRFHSDSVILHQKCIQPARVSISNKLAEANDNSKSSEFSKPSALITNVNSSGCCATNNYHSKKRDLILKPTSTFHTNTTLLDSKTSKSNLETTNQNKTTDASKCSGSTTLVETSASSEPKCPATCNLTSTCACCSPCSTRDCLFCTLYNRCCVDNSRKVTVVGAGNVGLAATICMLMQETTNNIALIDANTHKLTGEVMDFMHATDFVNYRVCGGSDFSITADSKVCIIATGAAQKQGESPSEVIQRNVDILKKVIPPLIRYSPSTIIVVVTNPLDILVYAAWRISGLPRHRVLGTGTILDSSRFRFFVSQRLRIAPTSIQAYVIGVHGPLLVPVWSNLSVGGARLCEFNPCIGTECDPEKWIEIYTELVYAARNVKKYKKFTSWGVALSTNKVVRAILTDSNEVYCLSTYVRGQQCVCEEVFLSLPCCICAEGIREIVRLNLSYTEWDAFTKSAKSIYELQSKIVW